MFGFKKKSGSGDGLDPGMMEAVMADVAPEKLEQTEESRLRRDRAFHFRGALKASLERAGHEDLGESIRGGAQYSTTSEKGKLVAEVLQEALDEVVAEGSASVDNIEELTSSVLFDNSPSEEVVE